MAALLATPIFTEIAEHTDLADKPRFVVAATGDAALRAVSRQARQMPAAPDITSSPKVEILDEAE